MATGSSMAAVLFMKRLSQGWRENRTVFAADSDADEELVFAPVHGDAVAPRQADAVAVVAHDEPLADRVLDHAVGPVGPVDRLARLDRLLDLAEVHAWTLLRCRENPNILEAVHRGTDLAAEDLEAEGRHVAVLHHVLVDLGPAEGRVVDDREDLLRAPLLEDREERRGEVLVG